MLVVCQRQPLICSSCCSSVFGCRRLETGIALAEMGAKRKSLGDKGKGATPAKSSRTMEDFAVKSVLRESNTAVKALRNWMC